MLSVDELYTCRGELMFGSEILEKYDVVNVSSDGMEVTVVDKVLSSVPCEQPVDATGTSNQTTSGGSTEEEWVDRKAKIWCITIHQADYEHLAAIENYLHRSKQLVYYLRAEHNLPNPHYHILAQYSNAIYCKKKYMFTATIKKFNDHGKRSTPQDYQRYCLGLDAKHAKLGIECRLCREEGELKRTGGLRIKDVEAMSPEDRKELPFMFYRTVEAMNKKEASEKKFREMLSERRRHIYKRPQVIVYNGESDSGKTTAAYNQAFQKYADEDIMRVNFDRNGFAHVDGDTGTCKCVVFEEFRSSMMALYDFCQLCDGNGYRLNIKGGDIFIRPERICFATIKDPRTWYADACEKDNEQRWQITKRISMIVDCYRCGTESEPEFFQEIRPKEKWAIRY